MVSSVLFNKKAPPSSIFLMLTAMVTVSSRLPHTWVHAGHLTVLQTTAGIKISLPDCFPATFTAVQQPIPPLSQKNCISKYSNFAMKSLYPTPAFCSRSVMICNVVVESACIGIPKRINGTVVTVECGRIEFAQKNSLSNFVKSYSGFVGIMKESALHRAQAISTPSNLPGWAMK